MIVGLLHVQEATLNTNFQRLERAMKNVVTTPFDPTIIPPGSIGSNELADNSVTSAKIAPFAVSAGDIAAEAVELSKFKSGIRPIEIVDVLPPFGTPGRVVLLTTDWKLYRDTGTAWTVAVPTVDLVGQIVEAQVADAAINVAKFALGIRPVQIVGALPSLPDAAYPQGAVVFLTTDNKMYRSTGSTWTAAVPTVDLTGTIVEAQIAAAAITVAKFAAGIRPVEIVGSLPAFGTQGRIVFLTTDNKMYRDTGSAWTAVVPATDITGQVISSQIADAAILTAKLADNSVALAKLQANSVDNSKLVDAAVTASKLIDSAVTTAKLADAALTLVKFGAGIRPVEIVGALPGAGTQGRTVFLTTDNKLYRDTGSAWVATVPTTDLTGTITSAQITDGAILAAKLAANSVALVNMQANSVDASQLVANAVTNVKIANAAVDAAKIAAAAVDASKLNVSIGGGNLVTDSSFEVGMTNWLFTLGGRSAAVRVQDAAVALHGTWYVKVNPATNGDSRFARFPLRVVSVGEDFVYSIHFRVESGTSDPLLTGLSTSFDNTATVTAGTTQLIDLGNGWYRISRSFAVTGAGNLYIGTNNTSGSGPTNDTTWRVDAGQVERGDVATAYAPKPDEILAGTITVTEIADNAVTTPKLIAGAVTTAKVAAGAITANEIAALAITAGKIAANAVTATEIAAGAITTAKLAAGAVTANEIAALAVVAGKIAANAVTATEIAALSITTAKIAAGAVTATEIAAATITGAKIAAGTITASLIAANTLTANEIAANAITSSELAANAVIAGKIAAGTIVAADISAGAITTEKLTVGSVSDNAVLNGSFEDPLSTAATRPASWMVTLQGTGTATRINTERDTGDWCMEVLGGGGNGARLHSEYIPVVPGEQWYISCRAKVAITTTLGFYLRATFYTSQTAAVDGNNGIIDVFSNLGLTTSWVLKEPANPITVPANSRWMRVQLIGWTASPAGTLYYFDEVVARKVQVSASIADGAIIAAKVAALAITAGKIAANAVTATEIAAGSITTGKIAAGAVTATEIGALAVTTAKLAAGAVTANEIAAGAIITAKISAGAVTTTELAALAVTTAKLAAGAVTANEIAADTITAGVIAAGAIGTSELAALAVTAAKIAAGTITAAEIAASTITGAKIAADTITGANIAAATITAAEIAADTITAGVIAAGAIGTSELAALAVNASKIAAGTITTNEIAANTILAGNIAADTITGAKIAANTITASEIAADTITAGQIAAGAIGTSELSAAAARIDKLIVGNFDNLAEDPSFERNLGSWTLGADWAIVNDPTNARTGNNVLRYNGVASAINCFSLNDVPCVPGDEFYLEAWAKSNGLGTVGSTNIRIHWLTVAKAFISASQSSSVTTQTTYTLMGASGVAPATAVYARCFVYIVTAPTDGRIFYVDDFYWKRRIVSAFISDAAIITAKIADLAVQTAKINDLAVTTIKVANLAITDAKIDTLAATKITAGTIGAHTIILGGATSILKSSNYVAGSAGWQIKGDGAAEFSGVTVRGTVDATTLSGANTISGTIQTASSGARAVLKAGTLTQIAFYTGDGTENSPGYSGATVVETSKLATVLYSPIKTAGDPRGYFTAVGNGTDAYVKLGRNAAIGDDTFVPTFQTGIRVLQLQNASAEPSSAPVGGALLYSSSSGNLKGVNTAGKVFPIGFKPFAKIYHSAAQNLTDNAITAITFNSEVVDLEGLHSTSTNPTRITPAWAGYYRVTGTVYFATNLTGVRYAYLLRNGTETMAIEGMQAGNGSVIINLTEVFFFNGTTDYVELYAYQNSGGLLSSPNDGTAAPALSVEFVNP